MLVLSFLAAAAGALVVLRDWRLTVPLLLVADVLRALLLWQAATLEDGRVTLVLVELATAAGVAGILLVTGLTFGRAVPSEGLDERAPFELRRARRDAARRERSARDIRASLAALGAVLLVGLATAVVVRAFPIARDPAIDAGWIFVSLCGLLALITAGDVLKLGLGLLLLAGSAKLLYFGITPRLLVLNAGLWEALSLGLALVAAALSGLLYGRLQTLELGSLLDVDR